MPFVATVARGTIVPTHDLGYRAWQGKRTWRWMRWGVVASTGIRLIWTNMWLRRMLLLAWLPAAVMGLGVFLYERALEQPVENRRFGFEVAERMGYPELGLMLRSEADDPTYGRHQAWALLLFSFFRYPQGVVVALVVGLIAPRLVAQDVRSRAFLLYFSRPLTPTEYIAGKLVILIVYLSIISTLPALALYVLAVGLSPSLDVVWATWDLPLRVLGASVVLMLPTTTLALCLSSLTSESRYAGFAWFAIWALGWIAYGTQRAIEAASQGTVGSLAPTGSVAELGHDSWVLVSLYHTLGKVQAWVFGLESFTQTVAAAAVVLLGISLLSLITLRRRVYARIRI